MASSHEDRPLLTARVIHSIPVVNSLWDKGLKLYGATKESNVLVKAGLELAERTAQPLVQKYKRIDNFASQQVQKVSSLVPTTTLVQSAAYPVGYAYGVALGGMTAIERGVEGTRFEDVLEKIYDVADSIIDGILPGEEEISRGLRNKNPIRRIGKRVSPTSLRKLPSNAAGFMLDTTKDYTRTAIIRTADYGIFLLWSKVDASYQNIERVASLLSRLNFVRGIVARTVPIYFDITDRYEFTKHIRQEGALFVQEALTKALSQLDAIHSLMLASYPYTSQIIERISMRLFNLESQIEYARTKKRALPFDESEEVRLKKRERFNVREPGKREEKGIWHKSTSKTKRHNSGNIPNRPTENPYSVLLGAGSQDMFSYNKFSKSGAHKLEDIQEEAVRPELGKGEAEAKRQNFADRAKLEMEKWAQQEKQALEEKQTKEQEQQSALKRATKERARKEHVAAKALQEQNLKKQIEKRERERYLAQRDAQLAQEKLENASFEKELAHYKASQAYKAAKAIRDAEIIKQKKREEIERNVQRALAEREMEEHNPERLANCHAKELIAEEKHEQQEQQELELQNTEVNEQGQKITASPRRHGKQKMHGVNYNKLTAKVLNEIKGEKKEVAVIGGAKIVDEHTNWVTHTDADGPWQTVLPSHATRMRVDAVINSSPIRDVDRHTADFQFNPYFPLQKSDKQEAVQVNENRAV